MVFIVCVAKFYVDLRPLFIPFHHTMPKVCLVLFFLLLGGACSVPEANSQTLADADDRIQLDLPARAWVDVDVSARTYTRGGPKFKRVEKRLPDTNIAHLDASFGLGQWRVAEVFHYSKEYRPVLRYYGHIHRQVLF